MSTEKSSKPVAPEEKQAFQWKMTIRAGDVDFMTTSDELSAGCNCNCDCSAISPMPPSARQPRRRQVEGR